MAIIPVPAKLSFTKIESFKLQRFTSLLRSRFTGQGQRIIYPFAVWMLEAKLKDYAPEDAGEIRAFLAELRGQANSFRLPVPGYTKPSTGYTANRGILTTTNPRATAITVNGGAVGAAYLNPGDLFTVKDELKVVTGNAGIVFNASGQATIPFEPPLRQTVFAGVGTPVIVNNPTCLMHAADDDIAAWGIRPPMIYEFDFAAVEAIDI